VIHDLELSQQLNLMKYSRAISCVRCLYESDQGSDDGVQDGPRNVSFIQTPGVVDSLRWPHQS
jgi:hypothetical protein